MTRIISDEMKRQRELAVTGLKGSTHITAFLLSAYQSVTGYLRDSLVRLMLTSKGSLHNLALSKNALCVIDFFTIVFPNILICILVDYVIEVTVGTFALALFLHLLAKKPINLLTPWKKSVTPYKIVKRKDLTKVSVKFMNQANSILLIATTISILFVDFLIYPRCLVKTENYGISLMDIGTGAILYVSGASYGLLEDKERSVDSSKISRFLRALKHNMFVLLIGIIRTIVIKAVNYQEHVSEYGVHWNFFLTIAAVSVLAALLPRPWQTNAHYLALAIMALYEIGIKVTGLEVYIVSNIERITFIDKNKEGIFQCFGYLSCYFCGMGLGEIYKQCALKSADWEFFKKQVLYLCLFFFIFVTCWMFQPTSRRLANINYVAFIAITVGGTIFLSYLKDEDTLTSETLMAINFNKLLYFLISNIMVGVVNLSIDTFLVPPIWAIVIVSTYLALVNAVMVILFRYNKRLPLL